MKSAPETAKEALRVLRKLKATFSNGTSKNGSGFVGPIKGTVITNAHVVTESGTTLNHVTVDDKPARVRTLYPDVDLAIVEAQEPEICHLGSAMSLAIGESLMFAGFPAGVAGPSVFTGILSAHGSGLIESPTCRLLQINGMINSGNSGGPVFKAGETQVIGVVTAKFVPLLREIDNLRDILRNIPQISSSVSIQGIDFGKFFNLTISALSPHFPDQLKLPRRNPLDDGRL
jgi:S1-C subfamily serine protease